MSLYEENPLPNPGGQPMMPPPPSAEELFGPAAADPLAQAAGQVPQAPAPAQPAPHDPFAQAAGQVPQAPAPAQPAPHDPFAQAATHAPLAEPASYTQPAAHDPYAQPAAHDPFAHAAPVAPQGGLPVVGTGDPNAGLFAPESDTESKKRFGRSKTGSASAEAGATHRLGLGSSGPDKGRIIKIAAAVIGGLILLGLIAAFVLGAFGGDSDSNDGATSDAATSQSATGEDGEGADGSESNGAAIDQPDDGTFTNATGAYTITPNANWTPSEASADAPEGGDAWTVTSPAGEEVGLVTVGLVDLTGISAAEELDLDRALEVILEDRRASGEEPTGGVGDVNGRSFAVVSSVTDGVANYSVMQLIDNGLLAATLTADPADIETLIDSEQDAMFTLNSLQ